jgi:hypothetical protein
MAVRFSEILEAFRAALRREQLPPPSPPAPRPPERPSLLQFIFAAEELPLDPAPPPSTEPGLITVLFQREEPGFTAPPPATPPSRWLAWLVRPEDLEP